MRTQPDDDDPSVSDEIATEDGTLRSWFFVNGEGVRTIVALISAICVVAWCFLYVLGYGSTVVGTVLLIVAGLSSLLFYGLVKEIRRHEESHWKKGRRSRRTERVEILVAGGLWLLIAVAVSLLLVSQHFRAP